MGRECCVLIALLLFCLSSNCQKPTRKEGIDDAELAQLNQIMRTLEQILVLLEEYHSNQTVPDLRQYMEEALFVQANGVLSRLRGWAVSEEQADAWRTLAQQYLWLLVLKYLSEYAISSTNFYVTNFPGIQTHRINSLRSRVSGLYYCCFQRYFGAEPSTDSVLRYETYAFSRTPIGVVRTNGAPWFQLRLRHYSETRFLDNYQPQPLAPYTNYVREIEILFNAQNTLITWSHELSRMNFISNTLTPHVDERLIRDLESSLLSTFRSVIGAQASMSSIILSQLRQLINVVLLNEFYRFIQKEYQRHLCHPAHQTCGTSTNNVVDSEAIGLRTNNLRLIGRMELWNNFLMSLLQNSALLASAYNPLMIQAYRVGYTPLSDPVTGLRMGYAHSPIFRPFNELILAEMTTSMP